VRDQGRLAAIELVAFDFDGVFTDNTVLVTERGEEAVRCWRSDGLGLSRLAQSGVKACIISTERNPVVSARAAKLQLPVRQAVEDKAEAVREACAEHGVPLERTMFVGNDINDIPAFRLVGAAVAVADAYPEVDPFIWFRTERPGGYGAVREVCDLIVAARAALAGGAADA
jgi:YrbI family 3-deoxy-D-manno-octulosonate 8-phosphate phosphatase